MYNTYKLVILNKQNKVLFQFDCATIDEISALICKYKKSSYTYDIQFPETVH